MSNVKFEIEATQERHSQASLNSKFLSACKSGDLPALNRLVKLAPEHVLLMIENRDYAAFQAAASGGHLSCLDRLAALVPDDWVPRMISAGCYEAFRLAAHGGHLSVLDRLVDLALTKVSEMIEAGHYAAFKMAAHGGHLSVLDRLVDLAPTKVSKMIEADYHEAFKMAAHGGHLPVLNRLMKLAPGLVSRMIEADDYVAFEVVANAGHLPALALLLMELAPSKVLEMVRADCYAAFRVAAGSGHLSILNQLVELVPTKPMVSDMMRADRYAAFRVAAIGGHLPVLNRLVELASTKSVVSAMIKANRYAAFQYAARGGHLPVLNRLMELAPDRLPRMIEANGYSAFSSVAHHHMDDIVNRALCDPGVFAHAEMHQREYGERYVNPFIHNELTALRALKTTFELENPNTVFNIIDETQARRCFYIIRNLIRRNQPDLLDDMRFLLAIPAVQALAHAPVTDNEPNELLRLALTTGDEGAAAVLLAIPAVNALAEQHQFYRHEARGAFDLEALARDRESSMRALCASEQQRLQAATDRYEPLIKGVGVEQIMSALRQTLSTRYAEKPARILGGQCGFIDLPQDWHAFQDLKLTSQQRGDALTAYHQHKDHTAWRYLLKPNPWMAMNATYVNVNPENALEKWSTFEEYKSLISMLYLAATDDGVPPTNGYTLETRLSHFLDELAHIGRAHNWDNNRKNAYGASEEYDDLTGDRPACFSGVKRRLFQSVQGHPLFEMLTLDDVRQELRDFMREHFNVRITPDNLAELSGAWDELCEAGVCGVCLVALNVSETDQHAFFQHMTEKYALQFTCYTSFEQYIKTSFDLTPVHPSHVARFAGETSFGDLLSKKRNLSQPSESTKKRSKTTLDGLTACGTFRPAEPVSQNSPTRTLSEKSRSDRRCCIC